MTGSAAPMSEAQALPKDVVTYPLSQADTGVACPATADGYGCTLHFNISSASPSASPPPAATPTTAPTSAPSSTSSGAPSASPSPAVPTLTLHAYAQPKDAPKMVHVPLNVLTTTPLMMVTLQTTADYKLDGPATASFTLPKEQIPNRGFALQLFLEKPQKNKTINYTPVWTFDKSSLKDNTLTFGFIPPKITVAKGITYALVLYGDDIPSSAAPSPKPPEPVEGWLSDT